MEVSKEQFYGEMYRDSDETDDDLDNFTNFRKQDSQHAIHSQEGHSRRSPLTVSSQDSSVLDQQILLATSLPVHLKDNYISSVQSFNKWLKLGKKDSITLKSTKLEGFVLFYWPASSSLPSKSRRTALGAVVSHSGGIAKVFDGGLRVTHIIVDSAGKGREYKDVLQNLKLDRIPDKVQLVKSGWVDEKIRPRYGLSSSEDCYRVAGYKAALEPSSKTIPTKRKQIPEADPPRASIKKLKSAQDDHRVDAEHIVPESNPVVVQDKESPLANSSPKRSPQLMKQCIPTNPGDRLAVRAILSGLEVEAGDEVQRIIEGMKLARDVYQKMERPSSYPTTDGGQNIDMYNKALHETELDEEYFDEDDDSEDLPSSKAKNFLCARKSLKGTTEIGPNAELIEQLKLLAAHYANKKDDMFRAKGYREAISIIRRQKHKITTKQQALDLRRIGTSIATKIDEFGKHGRIAILDAFEADPREQAITLFTGVYGVGQRTAEDWYSRGLRTLEELRKINLHEHQRIGLEHYDDFNSRIPRAEITMHVEYVTKQAKAVSEHLQVVVGGSYRRGQADSGDIDFLVTAADSIINTNQLQKLVFDQLIPMLRKSGYIKADLTTPSEDKESSKWLGAACLPGTKPERWRRVDMLVVPNAEWGAALLYFTGNDIFNRSMRLLARRTGGSLNQRGLYRGVQRDKNNVKIVPGTLVEGRDERKIFEALGVKWRPPHERCP